LTLRDPDHDAVYESAETRQVVVAPPGTGKTHVAVRLAGRLTTSLALHERVLLLTFSNQARVQLEDEAARRLRPVRTTASVGPSATA
jgi:superfamily II DNA or RNA helicase